MANFYIFYIEKFNKPENKPVFTATNAPTIVVQQPLVKKTNKVKIKENRSPNSSFDSLLDDVLDGPTQVVGAAPLKLKQKENNLVENKEKEIMKKNLEADNELSQNSDKEEEKKEKREEVKEKIKPKPKRKSSVKRKSPNNENKERVLPSYFNLNSAQANVNRKRKHDEISRDEDINSGDSSTEKAFNFSEESEEEEEEVKVNRRKPSARRQKPVMRKEGRKAKKKKAPKAKSRNGKRGKVKEAPDANKLIVQGKRARRKPKYLE